MTFKKIGDKLWNSQNAVKNPVSNDLSETTDYTMVSETYSNQTNISNGKFASNVTKTTQAIQSQKSALVNLSETAGETGSSVASGIGAIGKAATGMLTTMAISAAISGIMMAADYFINYTENTLAAIDQLNEEAQGLNKKKRRMPQGS